MTDDPDNDSEQAPLIYVSDDSDDGRRVVAALSGRGYEVLTVGIAGLVTRVAARTPALIFCDLDREGALQAIGRLRDIPGGEHIDVLFASAEPPTSSDLAHESSGNFVRPVDETAVLRKVEALAGTEGLQPASRSAATASGAAPPSAKSSPESSSPESSSPESSSPESSSPESSSPESPFAASPSPLSSRATPSSDDARPAADRAVPPPREESPHEAASAAASAEADAAPPNVSAALDFDATADLRPPLTPSVAIAPAEAESASAGSSEQPPEWAADERPSQPALARTSSHPSWPSDEENSHPSLPAPVPLGFSPEGEAGTRHIPQSEMSPELESLLARAEQRVGSVAPASRQEGERLSPDQEVETVLPAEVLAALEEPLELDNEDDDSELDSGLGTRSGTGGARTGIGTGPGSGSAVLGGTSAGTAAGPPSVNFPGSLTATGTGAGSLGTGVDATAPPLATGPVPNPPLASPPRAAPPAGPPPLRASPPPMAPKPPSWPAPPLASAMVTAVEARPPSRSSQLLSQPASDGAPSARPPSAGPPSAGPPPTTAAPLPPEHLDPAVASVAAQPGVTIQPGVRGGRRIPVPPQANGEVAPPPTSSRLKTPEVPAVLRPGDALGALARAVQSRFSGALAFEDSLGIRRVVMRDGDLVTAASGADGESLVSFLLQRGVLSGEVAARVGHRLPPFGRHAGAALIANGHLRQDELWPVLRAHSEWIVGNIIAIQNGGASIEREVPPRLRAEPAVFGGATGAEVLVEITRRMVPPSEALARLGGRNARMTDGPSVELLSECALSDEEVTLVNRCRSLTVGEVIDGAPGSFAAVLLGLVSLGVLETLTAARPGREAPQVQPDALDEGAVRARIEARRALVDEGDYFAVLGLRRGATAYDVRRAYLDLRREFEPGRVLTASNADLADDVSLILEVLDEAYEILRDNVRRERYRRALDATPL